MHYLLEKDESGVMRRHFGADMPPMSELANNIDLMLMNVYHVWDMNRPTSLNLVRIGGAHLREQKPPPEVFILLFHLVFIFHLQSTVRTFVNMTWFLICTI